MFIDALVLRVEALASTGPSAPALLELKEIFHK